MKIIDMTGPDPKPFKLPKAVEKRLDAQTKKYPWSFSVHITYGQSGKKFSEAHMARNEIEKKWTKFGKWIGHGSSLGVAGSCDVQVAFKNMKDVEKAKKVAIDIMFKHEVSGRYHIFDLREEE
jgi:hypothetical protein